MKHTADTIIKHQQFMWKKNRALGVLPEIFYQPTGIQLEITTLCNHHCIHCYNESGDYARNRQDKEMSDAQWLEIVDEIIDSNVFAVIISGGEPFMRTALVMKMIERFHAGDVRVGIISNGFSVTQDAISTIARCAESINWVQISLDGWQRDMHDKIRGKKGAFDRATETIIELRGREIPVKIAVALMAENRAEPENFFELALLLGANYLHIGDVFNIGAARSLTLTAEQKRITMKKLKKLKEAYQPYFNTMISMDPCMSVQVSSRYRSNNAYIIRPNGDLRLDCAVPVIFGRYKKPGDLTRLWQKGGLADAYENRVVRQMVNQIKKEQSFENIFEVQSNEEDTRKAGYK